VARRMLMPRRAARRATLALSGIALLTASGCGVAQSGNIDCGQQLFMSKCATCHALKDAGSTGALQGPDLDAAFAQARASGMDSDTIAGVVKAQVENPRPSTDNPSVSMPANLVTGEDLDDVATYVSKVAGVPGIKPPPLGNPMQMFAGNCASSPKGRDSFAKEPVARWKASRFMEWTSTRIYWKKTNVSPPRMVCQISLPTRAMRLIEPLTPRARTSLHALDWLNSWRTTSLLSCIASFLMCSGLTDCLLPAGCGASGSRNICCDWLSCGRITAPVLNLKPSRAGRDFQMSRPGWMNFISKPYSKRKNEGPRPALVSEEPACLSALA